jgi:hypothetical protein
MGKGNMQGLRLGINLETFETKFSDYVETEATPDHVILNFIETLPGAPEDQPNGRIASRIVLSWPHFARLSGMLERVLEENKDAAKDAFETLVFQGEQE